MYIIRKYNDLSKPDKFKVVRRTQSRSAAKVAMLRLMDIEENGNWILWNKVGKEMIRLQTLSNSF